MKYWLTVFAVVAMVACQIACTGALAGGTLSTAAPVQVPVYTFTITVCGQPVGLLDECPLPLPGAFVSVKDTDGNVTKRADENGHVMAVALSHLVTVKLSATGFTDEVLTVNPATLNGKTVSLFMHKKD